MRARGFVVAGRHPVTGAMDRSVLVLQAPPSSALRRYIDRYLDARCRAVHRPARWGSTIFRNCRDPGGIWIESLQQCR